MNFRAFISGVALAGLAILLLAASTGSYPSYSNFNVADFAISGHTLSLQQQIPASRIPAFSGDASTVAGNTVLTLATVNGNAGTWGDSTHVGQFTVNAKGLITAVSSVAIVGGGGGISIVQTNGVTLGTSATQINFVNGTNFLFSGTVSGGNNTITGALPSSVSFPGTVTASNFVATGGLPQVFTTPTFQTTITRSNMPAGFGPDGSLTNWGFYYRVWPGPTNTLTLDAGNYYFDAATSCAITNLILAGGWAVLWINNTNASTAIQVFSTVANAGTLGTLSYTANTNGIAVAAGKTCSFTFGAPNKTNWSNTVQQ